MDKIALISVIVILLVILLMLVLAFAYTRSTQRKREKGVEKQQVKPSRSFDELNDVITSRESSAAVLNDALDDLLLRYGSIHPKLGTRPHPDFDRYVEIIITVCRHPNTTKEIVLSFDKRLGEKNPTYHREIDDALQRGLSSRV